MISVDALKGFERDILTRFGIDSTPRQNKPCPSCGGRDRFTLFPDGRFYCRGCGYGDALDLIQKVHNYDLKTVLTMLDTGAQWVAPRPAEVAKPKRDTTQWRIEQILKDTTSITSETVAYSYLTQARGFAPDAIPTELLAHSGIDYWQEVTPGNWEPVERLATMVAPVRDIDDKVIALHITYLNPDGSKTHLQPAKKLIGSIKGGAIRLHKQADKLGLAEGIETALACNQLYGLPVWAVVSASFMPLVNLPSDVNDIYIFADNDSNHAGQRAAKKLAQRLLEEKRKVRVPITPTSQDTDFYDVWRNHEQPHLTPKP
jgi:putative DNA primase/helicase